MKCTWSKKNNIKTNVKQSNILLFVQYTNFRRSRLLLIILSLVVINATIGVCKVFVPRWILSAVQIARGDILRIAFYILAIELSVFLLMFVSTALNNTLSIESEQLFRNAYADLGVSQSTMKYEESVSPANLELLEGAKYGIWEIPALSSKLEKLGSSIVLMIVNCAIIFIFDWKYLLIPASSFMFLIPLYNLATKIEINNAKRLLPENRAFGWYCKLITDFRMGEDIRINKGEALISEHCSTLMNKIYAINQKSFTQKGLYLGLIQFLLQFQIVATGIILGYSCIRNSRNIEDFVLLFSAISSISKSSIEIVTGYNQVRKVCTLLSPFFLLRQSRLVSNEQAHTFSTKVIHKLSLENVSFSYPGSAGKALDHINLTISSGERVGIVGLNGAGKSTLAKLICGLYSPQEGRILIDGIDISTIPPNEFVKYVAVLFQDFQLLPVKLIENIVCKQNEKIDKSERMTFFDTLRSTSLHPWVASLKMKENTFITPSLSKDYVSPSGGQSQYIAMLRVIYKNSSICLFDEPTMALDSVNEKEAIQMMSSQNETIRIMISHRLSHVRLMDRIIVLSEGKVVEEGSHDALINMHGLYREMYFKQAKKYDIETH